MKEKKKLGVIGIGILALAIIGMQFFIAVEPADAKGPNHRVRVLRNQVVVLERMVADLQERVAILEQTETIPAQDYVTCYVQTPFSGTYFATEPNEAAAKAVVLYQCGNAMGCHESKIKCGR